MVAQSGGLYFVVTVDDMVDEWVGGLGIGVTRSVSTWRRGPDKAWRMPNTNNCSSPVLKPVTVARQHQHVLELEVLFEDHIVCSGVITDSLVLECVVHGQRVLIQTQPTALLLDNRQKRLHLLLNLAVTYVFPAHTSEFAIQILDLTHVWSNRDSGIVDNDLLALDAAVYMYIKLHLSPAAYPNYLQPSQRNLLDGNLTLSQDSTAPLPSSESYTQNSGCSNSWAMNSQLSHQRLGLTSFASASRCGSSSYRELNRLQPVVRADFLAFFVNQITATHFRDVSFSLIALETAGLSSLKLET